MKAPCKKFAPFLFLVARNYIHCCKWTDTKPVLNIFKIKVKQKEKIEKINALESKISLPQGSPTDSVRWSLLLGYRNYIMHCFLFPFCVITCYLEVYDAEV
jgi:hypothetical protein